MSTVTLHLGDCLEYLRTLEAGSVDAVVTDPPYGISHKSNGQLFRSAAPVAGDDSNALSLTVAEWAGETTLCMFFSPYRPLPIRWRSVLVWHKGPHMGIGGDRATCWKRDFELIGVRGNRRLNGKRDSGLLSYWVDANFRRPQAMHFCAKPVALMVYLIEKLTQPGDTVFDPFMGSGTTAVACIRTGRNFIGCEIDPGYHAIAQKRIAAEQAKMGLFEGVAK